MTHNQFIRVQAKITVLVRVDLVSLPSRIAVDISMARQSSHVLDFCVNFDRYISTHILS